MRMSKESTQHKLDRVRRPRVQITYDVETNGAMVKTELPFVVGVMADMSGQPKTALPELKDRKFINIDRDNINDVLAKAAPRLAMKVQNRLTDEDTKRAKTYCRQLLDQVVQPGQVVSKDVESNIKYWIAQIDKKLSSQLNEIMHDPGFQQLESTWCGLKYLVDQTETGDALKIR